MERIPNACVDELISLFVMAGLDPAIHVFLAVVAKNVDARDKPGHDAPQN